MPLGSGTITPTGQINVGEDIYLEGGPTVWFQSADAPLANDPDSNDVYYGLSGTGTHPIYEIGCYDDFQFVDEVTTNAVQCQALGTVDELQRREHLMATFTLKSLLPFSILSRVMRGGAVITAALDGTEAFGLGEINSQKYHLYFARQYDPDTGDYVSITCHRAVFTNASPLSTPYADAWNIPVEMKVLADRSKPRDQRFATVLRLDPSVIN